MLLFSRFLSFPALVLLSLAGYDATVSVVSGLLLKTRNGLSADLSAGTATSNASSKESNATGSYVVDMTWLPTPYTNSTWEQDQAVYRNYTARVELLEQAISEMTDDVSLVATNLSHIQTVLLGLHNEVG